MTIQTLFPASQTNTGVDNPNNILADDNAYATLDHNTDSIEVTGFSYAGVNPSQVLLCVSAKRANVANGQVGVSYKISGTPTGSSTNLKFTSPNETKLVFDVTADRNWTSADINNLTVVLTGVNLSASKAVDVDFVAVELDDAQNNTLTVAGRFARFNVNSDPVLVVSTPTGNDIFIVKILNLDENTQYLYVRHDSNVSEDTGWKLLPAQDFTTQTKGGVNFYVVFSGDIVEPVEVSMHEV